MTLNFKEEINSKSIRENEFDLLVVAIQRAIDLSYRFDTNLKDAYSCDNKAWISLEEIDSDSLSDDKISTLAAEFQTRVLDNNEFVDESQIGDDDQYATVTSSDISAIKSPALAFVKASDDDDEDEEEEEDELDEDDEEFDEDEDVEE
jgi:hypothetical protein